MPMSVTLTDASGTTHAATVSATYLNPCFSFDDDGPNGADLAVLRLSAPVSSTIATPVTRYSGSSEVGATFTLIGWGNFGPASPSPPSPCTETSCDQLRQGRNVFDGTRGNVLEYSLTDPDDAGVLSDEAIAWSGDSGGPAFLNGQLAGINSGGACCAYGSVDQYVRVSSTLSREWIDATITAGAAQSIADCSAWAISSSSSDSSDSSDEGDKEGDDDGGCGAGCIGGIIGGCFVPVLMLILWMSGVFGKKKSGDGPRQGDVTMTSIENAAEPPA